MAKTEEFDFSKESIKKTKNFSFTKFLFNLVVLICILVGIATIIFLIYVRLFNLPEALEDKLGFLFNNKTKVEQEVKKENAVVSFDIKDYSKMGETIAKNILPSVVGIEIEQKIGSAFNSGIQKGYGTGVIIDKNGYILTNGHVVSPESNSPFVKISEINSLKVVLNNGEKVDGSIVGIDSLADIAVVKINKENLTPAKLGNSDDVKVGSFAMAVGNPLNLSGSITAGIISGVNRNIKISDTYSINAIQTDAAINRGNSGGPLVNSEGEVIGINTLKVASNGVEGIGFSIPINLVKDISKQLIENKTVKRPSLGISGSTIPEDVIRQFNLKPGVLVQKVFPNTGAAMAGLKEKDVIIKFDNNDVKSIEELIDLKNKKKINDEVEVVIIRDNKEQKLKVKLLENKTEEQ